MDKTINWLNDNKNEFCVNNKTNVMVSQDNGKLNTAPISVSTIDSFNAGLSIFMFCPQKRLYINLCCEQHLHEKMNIEFL